jgi:hypothetical protein
MLKFTKIYWYSVEFNRILLTGWTEMPVTFDFQFKPSFSLTYRFGYGFNFLILAFNFIHEKQHSGTDRRFSQELPPFQYIDARRPHSHCNGDACFEHRKASNLISGR